ncbi:MAG: hypothetical protein R3F38_07070 [Gammaproteobacteria bacterium]
MSDFEVRSANGPDGPAGTAGGQGGTGASGNDARCHWYGDSAPTGGQPGGTVPTAVLAARVAMRRRRWIW